MTSCKAAARAHPSIALSKHWGNRDQALRLPSNPLLSMNMAGLTTMTAVEFDPALKQDVLILADCKVSYKSGPGTPFSDCYVKYSRRLERPSGASPFR